MKRMTAEVHHHVLPLIHIVNYYRLLAILKSWKYFDNSRGWRKSQLASLLTFIYVLLISRLSLPIPSFLTPSLFQFLTWQSVLSSTEIPLLPSLFIFLLSVTVSFTNTFLQPADKWICGEILVISYLWRVTGLWLVVRDKVTINNVLWLALRGQVARDLGRWRLHQFQSLKVWDGWGPRECIYLAWTKPLVGHL